MTRFSASLSRRADLLSRRGNCIFFFSVSLCRHPSSPFLVLPILLISSWVPFGFACLSSLLALRSLYVRHPSEPPDGRARYPFRLVQPPPLVAARRPPRPISRSLCLFPGIGSGGHAYSLFFSPFSFHRPTPPPLLLLCREGGHSLDFPKTPPSPRPAAQMHLPLEFCALRPVAPKTRHSPHDDPPCSEAHSLSSSLYFFLLLVCFSSSPTFNASSGRRLFFLGFFVPDRSRCRG